MHVHCTTYIVQCTLYIYKINVKKRVENSSIYNKDLSTPGQSRVCSYPCYIYYFDDETIPFQVLLCKFGF